MESAIPGGKQSSRIDTERVARLGVIPAVAFLLMAAAAKIVTATLDLRMLDLSDPILFVRNRYVPVAVAIVEILCVLTIMRVRDCRVKGLVLLWLGGNFVLYRTALALSGAGVPCPCLGSLGANLGLGSTATEFPTKGMAAYLLVVGSYLLVQPSLVDRFRKGPPVAHLETN